MSDTPFWRSIVGEDDVKPFTLEAFEAVVEKMREQKRPADPFEPLRCPGCREVHNWSYGEPINGMPVVLCSNAPPDKLYMIPNAEA